MAVWVLIEVAHLDMGLAAGAVILPEVLMAVEEGHTWALDLMALLPPVREAATWDPWDHPAVVVEA
jgi:hypothetical protein